jgi:predicted DNA-binding protein with PD1-like motif
MKASELKAGRTFGVTFQHGDEFMSSLAEFCRENEVQRATSRCSSPGFAEADIVGTCEKLEDPQAPVWPKVHVTNVEALGCGTIARDDADGILPHVHVAVGLKEHSAMAHASHLLSAKVQFLTEMLVVEILAALSACLAEHGSVINGNALSGQAARPTARSQITTTSEAVCVHAVRQWPTAGRHFGGGDHEAWWTRLIRWAPITRITMPNICVSPRGGRHRRAGTDQPVRGGSQRGYAGTRYSLARTIPDAPPMPAARDQGEDRGSSRSAGQACGATLEP